MVIHCKECRRRTDSGSLPATCQCVKNVKLQESVKPWELSLDIECPACLRTYDQSTYRDLTEIVCSCGNVITIERSGGESIGRRETDRIHTLLAGRMHLLADCMDGLMRCEKIREACLLAVQHAAELLDSARAALALRVPYSSQALLLSESPQTPGGLREETIDVQGGIIGSCFVNGEPIVSNSAQTDPRYDQDIDALGEKNVESILCIPVLTNTDCFGVLEVSSNRTAKYQEHDMVMGRILAYHLGAYLGKWR